MENGALLRALLRALLSAPLLRAPLRAPKPEEDILAEEPEEVVAVGEATCCKCIRDTPARLRCISRARFDE